MNFDRDTTAIVVNRDCAVLTINIYFDRVHARIADLIVCSIDENFVKDFIETRNNSDVPKV